MPTYNGNATKQICPTLRGILLPNSTYLQYLPFPGSKRRKFLPALRGLVLRERSVPYLHLWYGRFATEPRRDPVASRKIEERRRHQAGNIRRQVRESRRPARTNLRRSRKSRVRRV